MSSSCSSANTTASTHPWYSCLILARSPEYYTILTHADPPLTRTFLHPDSALAKAGRSVLHLDPNHYYGGEQASLTLDELAEWAGARSGNLGTESLLSNLPSDSTSSQLDSGKLAEAGPSNYLAAQRARYTRASTTALSPSLQADKRRYAISLFPALMPSRGALVGTLIASDVSKYVTFKLLDGVHVWTGSEEQTHRVPGSKEDVFNDKSVSLPDKRKLMKALMFAGGDFEQDPALQGRSWGRQC